MRRRTFLGVAAAAGPAVASSVRAAASSGGTLWVYDPTVLMRTDLLPEGAERIAVQGDRVRLARRLLAQAPQEIRGVTRYADFLMLSGAASEQGYRVASRIALDGNLLGWAVRR